MADMYEDLRLGRGIFSPLSPFGKERVLAREAAPQVVRARGGVQEAGLRAAADVAGELVRGKAGIESAKIGEAGAMERQSLISETNKMIQELINRGMLKGKRMEIAGLYDRLKYLQGEKWKQLKYGEEQATGRLQKQIGSEEMRFHQNRLDRQTEIDRLSSELTTGGGGYIPPPDYSAILGEQVAEPAARPGRYNSEQLDDLYRDMFQGAEQFNF